MEYLELYPSEMMEVMADRKVWRLILELLPCNPHGQWRRHKFQKGAAMSQNF